MPFMMASCSPPDYVITRHAASSDAAYFRRCHDDFHVTCADAMTIAQFRRYISTCDAFDASMIDDARCDGFRCFRHLNSSPARRPFFAYFILLGDVKAFDCMARFRQFRTFANMRRCYAVSRHAFFDFNFLSLRARVGA